MGKQWSYADWQRLAAVAISDIDAGKDKGRALALAQKVVITDKARHKTAAQLIHGMAPSAQGGKAIVEVRKMTQQQREALFSEHPTASAPQPPPAPEKKPAGRPAGHGVHKGAIPGNVRWTEREKLLVFRRIKDWRTRLGDQRSMSQLAFAAQDIELPPDRRRPMSSLTSCKAQLELDMKELAQKFWQINGVEFIPEAKTYEQAHPAPAPAVNGHTVLEFVQATTPSPAPRSGLEQAFQAFADHMLAGLGPLMAAHEQHILAQVRDELAGQGAIMVREMSELVAMRVDKMLGGAGPQPQPVAQAMPQPDAPPPPAPAAVEAKPEAPRVKAIKVDILGILPPSSIIEVERNFADKPVELQFIHPDKANTYARHSNRNCVLILDRMSHSMARKFRASGATPIYSKPTAGHVTRAIEELVAQQKNKAELIPA